jgi:hypothetical protein
VSLKSSLWRYLGLLAVAALAVGVFAGPASAKKLSAKQRAAVRAQLKKQVKKNPAIINRKSFVKKAGRVDFVLPITVRLRGGNLPTNPNSANLDLGASLGNRQVNLGGALGGEIQFHDSYDGGALGNVDIRLFSTSDKSLTTTSIPLLWNTQVSAAGTSWDSNLIRASNPAYPLNPGCGNVHTANANANGNLPFGAGALPTVGGPGLSGVPIYPDLATYAAHGAPTAFAPAAVVRPAPAAPAKAMKTDINDIAAGGVTGDDNIVGANPDPFPVAASHDPGADGTTGQPTTADTVLRTNALKLGVAAPGVVMDSGVEGGENITAGKSGGQANLFGNIPGKSVGIDVTVNLATKINSIIRIVDQDVFEPLVAGNEWPAAVFSCGQIWTGSVQNYIPGVRLQGALKISPGITGDGKLRIAKATLQSHAGSQAEFAVAACLAPYSAYNAEQNGSDTVTPLVPGTPANADGTVSDASLPVKPNEQRTAPAAACNADPTAFIKSTAAGAATVDSLATPDTTDGYSTTSNGSKVSIAAGLSVTNVSADILIGDV